MNVGDDVQIKRKGRVVATGKLLRIEWDDGYIGNPESWATVSIETVMSEKVKSRGLLRVGVAYSFRGGPGNTPEYNTFRRKTEKGRRPLGIVSITVVDGTQAIHDAP